MFDQIDFDSIGLEQNPPSEEPKRQYYYMAKCRQYIKAESEHAGRALTATVITFGCQVNTEHGTGKAA